MQYLQKGLENLQQIYKKNKVFQLISGKNWNLLFPNANPEAIDLLQKLLIFDPKKRITLDEAF